MKKVNILFLGGAKRVSLASLFIEAGKVLDKDVSIFSYELSHEVPISLVGTTIIGKKWKDPNVYGHLLQTIKDYRIDILIPFVDPATVVAAKFKDFCEHEGHEIFIPVSTKKECKLFFDKSLTEEWCLSNEVSYPICDGTFPMFQKPITGSASQGIKKIDTQEELDKVVNNNSFIIQKYIDGEEYSIDIYRSIFDKEIKAIAPRVRMETQGGESIKSITVKDNEIISFAKYIVNKTQLFGPLTLQVLKDKDDGKLYFMELNPRFGGAVITSIGAGVDIPSMIFKDYLKLNSEVCNDWKENYMMIRYFKEFFLCK